LLDRILADWRFHGKCQHLAAWHELHVHRRVVLGAQMVEQLY
jgi:hypothetical protein